MRRMYDAVTPSAVPASATMVAGYIDGNYQSYAGLVSRFPYARHVSITTGLGRANVIDVESGNVTDPPTVARWVAGQYAAGRHPCVYGTGSTISAVDAACHARGISRPLWWLADWDGQAILPAGYVAKQYQSTPGYDVSVVADYWPGIDPTPAPPPSPAPGPGPAPHPPMTGEPTVIIVQDIQTGAIYLQTPEARLIHIPDTADVSAYAAKFGPPVHITHDMLAELPGILPS